VQVSHQVVKLLLRELVLERRHLGTPDQDNIGNTGVVGGNAVLHVGMLEQAAQARCFEVMLAVGVVTLSATSIIDTPTLRLLRRQAQFSVGLAGFGITGAPEKNYDQRKCCCRYEVRAGGLQTKLSLEIETCSENVGLGGRRAAAIRVRIHLAMAVYLKRIYEKPAPEDGSRVLVDRLWPRGLTKDDAALHAWMKELAPSNELRKWFHVHPLQWEKFRKRYLKELAAKAALTGLQQLHDLAQQGRLTLLYASKNEERNNAVVLKQLVDGERKPPTGTGPVRAAALGKARGARSR
jgi:uncharacterized protein YeaO (DUF488 family)